LSETIQLKFRHRIKWSFQTISQLQAIVDLAAQTLSSASSTRALLTEITFEQVCKLPPSRPDDGRLHGEVMEVVMSFRPIQPATMPSTPLNSAWYGEAPCPSHVAPALPKPVADTSSVQSPDSHKAYTVERKLQSFRTPPPRTSNHFANEGSARTTPAHQMITGSPGILFPGAHTRQSGHEGGWHAWSALTEPPSPPPWTGGEPRQGSGRFGENPTKGSPPPRREATGTGGSSEGLRLRQSCHGCQTPLVSNAVACPKCGLPVTRKSFCRECTLEGTKSVHCTFCSKETPVQ
jgi:hypothetical protein